MRAHEVLFESLLAFSALTALNLLIFHDSVIVSLAGSAAILCSFWFGRLSVRFIKQRLAAKRVLDE